MSRNIKIGIVLLGTLGLAVLVAIISAILNLPMWIVGFAGAAFGWIWYELINNYINS